MTLWFCSNVISSKLSILVVRYLSYLLEGLNEMSHGRQLSKSFWKFFLAKVSVAFNFQFTHLVCFYFSFSPDSSFIIIFCLLSPLKFSFYLHIRDFSEFCLYEERLKSLHLEDFLKYYILILISSAERCIFFETQIPIALTN